MRFRQQKNRAHRFSWLLLVVYVAAVCAQAGLAAYLAGLASRGLASLSLSGNELDFRLAFWSVFALMVLVVVSASLLRLYQLKQKGGVAVVEALGGRLLQRQDADVYGKRLLNVVEETALAARLPVPLVYVLPERNINALAAGWSEQEAVIGLTMGALYALKRDELQAVVAHEFSHIANDDMRLNMRLSGWLFGLQMVTAYGNVLTTGRLEPDWKNDWWEHEMANARPGVAVLPTAVLGVPLLLVGSVGSLLAGWLQAAVSRQREYLADASAVEFTRQSEGLLGALYKMAMGDERFASPHSAEYAHFMFGNVLGHGWLERLAATHPSVLSRLQRISPSRARQWRRQLEDAESISFSSDLAGEMARHSAFGRATDSVADREWLARNSEIRTNQMRRRLQKLNPNYAEQAFGLLNRLPGLWLELEGDEERLLVSGLYLLSPENMPAAAQSRWLVRPLRVSMYQLVSRTPLSPAQAFACFYAWLPLLVGLDEAESKQVWTELNHCLSESVLPHHAVCMLILAEACLGEAVEAEGAVVAADILLVEDWLRHDGQRDMAACRALADALRRLSASASGVSDLRRLSATVEISNEEPAKLALLAWLER